MPLPAEDLEKLKEDIRDWAAELGFQQLGVSIPDLTTASARLREWLEAGMNGTMGWFHEREALLGDPAAVVPGTVRVMSLRMNYMREDAWPSARLADDSSRARIARFALGRDYHRIMRPRLQKLAARITEAIGPFGYRVFVDSGPVMEKPLAQQAGLGWMGKHTVIINKKAGSMFLLGDILTDLPLPPDAPAEDHCGSCSACISACPTGAIIAPYRLDARRCITYLTIENRGPIPEELRPAIGNRVFGCDDCQVACPWNKFARPSMEQDFAPRHGLDRADLVELFLWSRGTWEERTAGSAIRRARYEGWLRNLAVALGNAPGTDRVIRALESRLDDPSELVREHVRWALAQHGRR